MLYFGQTVALRCDKSRGIRLNGQAPEIVTIGENGITLDDIIVHDETAPEPNMAYILGRMQYPDFPVPVGVFRVVSKPTYEDLMAAQIAQAINDKGRGNVGALLNAGETWTIDEEGEQRPSLN